MKPWQHGYDIDYLKGLEKQYAEYNKYTLSPFAKYKKNNIAESLHKGTLVKLDETSMLDITVSKSASNITMHGDTIIAKKQKGDVTFGKLVGDTKILQMEIVKYKSNDCWLYAWAENTEHCKFAEDMGFCYVGPKITTYGEIFAIYYRGKQRELPKVDPAEYLSIKKVGNLDVNFIEKIHSKLNQLPSFTNHYSNYNKDKAWGALSLRGYTRDPAFITKPAEMNDKWKEENKDNVFGLIDTPLYEVFPEVREFVEQLGKKIHRVRFMRLKPGGGELERHTDQVDSESGGSKGKLARIHVPIKTNDDVIFTVWNTKGKPEKINMKVGEYWFLDTRKAHQAINGGAEERIHLVIDVVSEGNLYDNLVA
jgi:hypothetical protein